MTSEFVVDTVKEGDFELKTWSNNTVSVRVPDGFNPYLIVTIKPVSFKENGYKLEVNRMSESNPRGTFVKLKAIKKAKEYLWRKEIESRKGAKNEICM